jgi:hypothetical protein
MTGIQRDRRLGYTGGMTALANPPRSPESRRFMCFAAYCRTAAALVSLLLCGCGSSSMKDYERIHRSASSVLPAAVEMEEMYGSADHFITHFGLKSQKTNTWNTEVFFGDRYELTMQVEVLVHYDDARIEVIGDPHFYLREVERVDVSDDGRVSGSYSGGAKFSNAEWKKVYEAHGDFAVIGIKLNPEPVENFDKNVAAVRTPRIPIRLIEKK